MQTSCWSLHNRRVHVARLSGCAACIATAEPDLEVRNKGFDAMGLIADAPQVNDLPTLNEPVFYGSTSTTRSSIKNPPSGIAGPFRAHTSLLNPFRTSSSARVSCLVWSRNSSGSLSERNSETASSGHAMTLRYTLAAAIALAATPADAQEATARDSSATDTDSHARQGDMTDSLKAVITVHRDSMSGRLDSAKATMLRVAAKGEKGRSGGRWAKPSGSLEIGGIHGTVPFSYAQGNLWNAYAKGAIGLDLLGAPLQVIFDLGTDLPISGQRNKIRFAFDPGRAALNERWNDARQLHDAKAKLDSLQGQQALLQRGIEGTKARLRAEREARSRALADSIAQQVPSLDSLTTVPAFAQPTATDSLFNPSDGQTITASTPNSVAGFGKVPQSSASQTRIDSLEQQLRAQETRMRSMQEKVAQAKQAAGLKGAITRAGIEKAPLAQRIAQGIRRFEIGSCTPEGSDFLINGITLQGISFTYAHKDLFLAFDHGRTLDDAARDAAPISNRLRQLHQSLFMADTRDLNPRRITDLRIGFGDAEGTHAHIGLLRGTRFDHPAGSNASPDSRFAMRNHVAEVDAGVEVKKGHSARFIYARSATGPLANAENDAQQDDQSSSLFSNDPRAEAMKLSWTSDFRRIGTRVALEGRRITPWFQSYGLGFLRPGSRAGELRLDQSLGARARLRAKGSAEERTSTVEDGERSMIIQRAQLALQLRPIRTLSVTASYAPVRTHWTDGENPALRSENYTLGANLRERWRKTVVTANATLSLYQWTTSEVQGGAWNGTAGASIAMGKRCTLGGQWTMLRGTTTDTIPTATNIGVNIGYRSDKGLSIDASVQFPDAGAVAWHAEARQVLRKGFSIGFRSQRYPDHPELQGGDALVPPTTDQAFTLFLNYQW